MASALYDKEKKQYDYTLNEQPYIIRYKSAFHYLHIRKYVLYL